MSESPSNGKGRGYERNQKAVQAAFLLGGARLTAFPAMVVAGDAGGKRAVL